MNFDPSDLDQMVTAMVERFAKTVSAPSDCGSRRATWRALGEAGLIATAFHPSRGGLELDPSSIAALFEALGRALVVTPLIECGLVSAAIFDRRADDALARNWSKDLCSGQRMVALAHRERGAQSNKGPVETTANKDGRSWALNGAKSLVPGGVDADAFIVTARTADPGKPVSLFFVPADTSGLTRVRRALIDGSSACALELTNVTVDADHCLRGGLDALDDVETRAVLARCAEAVGVMELLFDQTLQYLRTRTQFGRPIGAFQALQHRMVTQYLSLEQARGLLHHAIVNYREDSSEFRETVAGVRAFISEASLGLGHEAIQMHGAMGVTDELIIGRAHKRLVMLARYPTTPAADLDLYAGLAAA